LKKRSSLPNNILILTSDSEESSFLKSLATDIGSVYLAPNLEKAIDLVSAISINVVIVDSAYGRYDRLRGLFKPLTSIIIMGSWRTELKTLAATWPVDRYVDISLTAEAKADADNFKRIAQTAMQHAQLLQEVEHLRLSLEENDVELQEAFHQIDQIKATVETAVVSELEKRIEMEAKYQGFRREKQKIEAILKNLYQANDVTMLLDIVYDIKDLVQSSGITMYIMDESDTTGKYLKPLVWDDSLLSHTEFTKHIVLLDIQDFAAATAIAGHNILSTDPSDDKRLSSRYLQHLKTSLDNILCVPIKQDREVIGVLEVYNKTVDGKIRPEGFTAEDENVLEQICEHIAIAINKLNLIQYDALTGLLRPEPFFDRVLQKLRDQTKRHQEEDSFSMVMGDVDWFKHYNDRNGHEAGNKLLRELAEILKSSTREGDILCRYGGEEFLFFLSCQNCGHESMLFTNRIRKNIENHYFDYQEFQPHRNLTMSFGITNFSRDRFGDPENITRRDLTLITGEADMALAEAKGKRRSGPMPEEIDEEEFPAKNKITVYLPKVAQDKTFPEAISDLNGAKDAPAPPQTPLPPLPQAALDKLKPSTKKEDKRKFPRHDISSYVLYKNGVDTKVVRALNMSLGGVKIVAQSSFDRGQSFELSLILGDRILECKGDVVYCVPANTNHGYFVSGVKFRDLSFNDWKALESYFDDMPEIAQKKAAH
jgi:diguanylate cyclase (GGDEF)-like protein